MLLELIGSDGLSEIGVQSKLHAAKIKTKLPTLAKAAKPAYTKVRAYYSCGLCSYGLYSYGLCSYGLCIYGLCNYGLCDYGL